MSKASPSGTINIRRFSSLTNPQLENIHTNYTGPNMNISQKPKRIKNKTAFCTFLPKPAIPIAHLPTKTSPKMSLKSSALFVESENF